MASVDVPSRGGLVYKIENLILFLVLAAVQSSADVGGCNSTKLMPNRWSLCNCLGILCRRNYYIKQIMSGFAETAWINRSGRLEQTIWILEFHTVRNRGGVGMGRVGECVDSTE